MAGIHIHPHDIVDEGISNILDHLDKMKEIRFLFPQANSIFERNPYPAGRLPHNPVHEYVQGLGTLHLQLDPQELYKRLYQKVDSSITENKLDPMMSMKKLDAKYTVVPWFNLLNGDFSGDMEQNGVVDFRGNPVPYWLCPNGLDVIPMWTSILLATERQYDYSMFMIDRIRYPDWAGKKVNPSGIFSCFCQRCQQKMSEKGIDVSKLMDEMKVIVTYLHHHQFDRVVKSFRDSSLLHQWITFRQDSVAHFVEKLLASVQEHSKRMKFWLDLWPPSYAWFLGQDYRRLTQTAPLLKHFPYHKLGGGADVQGLIEYFADCPDQQEAAFQSFLKLFQLDYTLTYQNFKEKGYPLHFVRNENNIARRLSQPGTQIYSGIQMWNISTEDLLEAVEEAKMSDADQLIYYCYGWAEIKHFEAIGGHSKEQ